MPKGEKLAELNLRRAISMRERQLSNYTISEGLKLLAESKRYGAAFDEIMALRQQLAAALAACALQRKALLDTVAYLSAAASAYEKFVGRHGVRGHPDALFLTRYADFIAAEKRGREALAIQPDASILKAHDADLIERCAKAAEDLFGPMCSPGLDIAATIRKLKDQL